MLSNNRWRPAETSELPQAHSHSESVVVLSDDRQRRLWLPVNTRRITPAGGLLLLALAFGVIVQFTHLSLLTELQVTLLAEQPGRKLSALPVPASHILTAPVAPHVPVARSHALWKIPLPAWP